MSNLNHSVKSISTMKSGLRLDLGERSDAYLPYSMIEERVSEGDTLVGTYEMRGDSGSRYAHITSLDQVIAATPAGESADTMSAVVDIKNIQPAKSGYVMWSKSASHRQPTFVPFSALKGVNIFKAQKVEIDYRRTENNRLVVSSLRVVESK